SCGYATPDIIRLIVNNRIFRINNFLSIKFYQSLKGQFLIAAFANASINCSREILDAFKKSRSAKGTVTESPSIDTKSSSCPRFLNNLTSEALRSKTSCLLSEICQNVTYNSFSLSK